MINASALLDDLEEEPYQPTQTVPARTLVKSQLHSSFEDSPHLTYGFIDNDDETQIDHQNLHINLTERKKDIEIIECISSSESLSKSSATEFVTRSKQTWKTSNWRKKSKLLSPKTTSGRNKSKSTTKQLKLENFFSMKQSTVSINSTQDLWPLKRKSLPSDEEPVKKRLKKEVMIDSTLDLLLQIGNNSNTTGDETTIKKSQKTMENLKVLVEQTEDMLKWTDTEERQSPQLYRLKNFITETKITVEHETQQLSLKQSPIVDEKLSEIQATFSQNIPSAAGNELQQITTAVNENIFYSELQENRIIPLTADSSESRSFLLNHESATNDICFLNMRNEGNQNSQQHRTSRFQAEEHSKDSTYSDQLASLPLSVEIKPHSLRLSLDGDRTTDNFDSIVNNIQHIEHVDDAIMIPAKFAIDRSQSSSVDFDNMNDDVQASLFEWPVDSQGYSLDFRILTQQTVFVDSQPSFVSQSVQELSQLPPKNQKKANTIRLNSSVHDKNVALDSQHVVQIAFNESAFIYDDLMHSQFEPIVFSQNDGDEEKVSISPPISSNGSDTEKGKAVQDDIPKAASIIDLDNDSQNDKVISLTMSQLDEEAGQLSLALQL